MHACHLGEDVLAYNGHVGCHGYATIALYQSADGIELAFVNRGACVELIFQNGLHTGKGSVATTLPEAVDCDVNTTASAQHGSQGVGHGKVVVVVGMEVEMLAGIAS